MDIPSGKHTQNYMEHHHLKKLGKSTNQMEDFL